MKFKVGLFGSRVSNWRESVINSFNREGIAYFNPVVSVRTPKTDEIEVKELSEDIIIFFVIPSDDDSSDLLAEVGFTLHETNTSRRKLILVIQPYGDDPNSKTNLMRNMVKHRAEENGCHVYDDLEQATSDVIRWMKS